MAAAAAIGFLTIFVLVFEARLDVTALRESLFAPVNVVRLVVLTACLALWGYIARVVRSTPARSERDPAAFRLDTRSSAAH